MAIHEQTWQNIFKLFLHLHMRNKIRNHTSGISILTWKTTVINKNNTTKFLYVIKYILTTHADRHKTAENKFWKMPEVN
jgi:hypothetical protein